LRVKDIEAGKLLQKLFGYLDGRMPSARCAGEWRSALNLQSIPRQRHQPLARFFISRQVPDEQPLSHGGLTISPAKGTKKIHLLAQK